MFRTKNLFSTLLAAPLGLLLAGFLLAAPLAARADIVVNVDQGVTQPLPIAIPAFGGSSVGGQVSQVVTADLDKDGKLDLICCNNGDDNISVFLNTSK